MNAYRAPAWLPGGHAQTIYAALAAPRPHVVYRRERWDTPDGDFIDLDWLDAGSRTGFTTPKKRLWWHCFTGSKAIRAATTRVALMAALQNAGWRGVVIHFRGCSGELNRLPRAYHSGDSAEIDWILRRLRQRHPAAPLLRGRRIARAATRC